MTCKLLDTLYSECMSKILVQKFVLLAITLFAFDATGKEYSMPINSIVNFKVGLRTFDVRGKVQKDGKILISGSSAFEGRDQVFMVRRNKDGSADTSFGDNGFVALKIPGYVLFNPRIELQSDNKIIFLATASSDSYKKLTGIHHYYIVVARYTDDGKLDKSFNGTGIVKTDMGDDGTSQAHSVAIQKDGKIVVVGSTDQRDIISSCFQFIVLRYTPEGSLDYDFGEGGKAIDHIGAAEHEFTAEGALAVAIQDDDKILVGGYAHARSGRGTDLALVRYLPNGRIDRTFGDNGKVIEEGASLHGIGLRKDGRIVAVCVSKKSPGNSLVLYDHNGKSVIPYHMQYKSACCGNKALRNVAIDKDDKVTYADKFEKNFVISRYDRDGNVDKSLGGDGLVLFKEPLFHGDLCQQADGNIVIIGNIQDPTNDCRCAAKTGCPCGIVLIRLDANGDIDETFGSSLSGKAAFTYKSEQSASIDSPLPECLKPTADGTEQCQRKVILGTWYWDVESGQFGKTENADFWWSQSSAMYRDLRAVRGTLMKTIKDKPFDDIDLNFIKAQKMDKYKYDGNDIYGEIQLGTIIIFKTGDGSYGKMLVERYRSSHDFDFEEAKYLEEEWKKFTLSRPEIKRYHLQTILQLYK